DSWKWGLTSVGYTVASARQFIDDTSLPEMWSSLGRWYSLVIPECSSIHEWFSWIDAAHMPKRPKIILEGVTSIMLWSIWNFRNSWVFSDRKLKKANVWDLFVHQSYLWISSRNPKFSIRWIDWIKNPTETLM
ncbi:hypothetical protein Tco_0873615, partial [Tanacetum coccineum]